MKKLLLHLFLIAVFHGFSYSQAGSLDATFGIGGKVITDFNGSFDNGYSIAIQNDDKILVAGTTYDGSFYEFGLVRYNVDGSLDNSFGSSGKVTTNISVNNDYARAISIQTDGKIIVAGQAKNNNGNEDFAVVRYNINGTLDNTFGSAGIVTTSFSNGDDEGWSVTLQPDGKIIVAGIENSSFNTAHFAIARYNTNGSLDNSFGTTGKVITSFGVVDAAYALAMQSDGKIIVTGGMSTSLTSSAENFATSRYNSDGTLDNSFGSNGKVITDISGTEDWGYSVAIQSDGKIITGGESNSNFALVRYNNNGSLDSTFGLNGHSVTPIGSGNDYVYSVAISNDSKIIAAGYCISNTSNNQDFALARYNIDGNLDSTFGIFGKVITPIGNSFDYARSVAIQPDGKILAAGYTNNGVNNDFAIARYDLGVVSINEKSTPSSTVNIYPNPFTSQTTISFSESQKNTTIKITDLLGKEIKAINFSGKQLIIDKGEMKAGIYFVQITDSSADSASSLTSGLLQVKNVMNKKIIIQ